MSSDQEARIRAKWTAVVPIDGEARRMIVNNDVAVLLDEIERLRGIVASVIKPKAAEAA